MHEKVKVICLNNNQNFEVEMGTSLLELLPKTNLDCKYPMLAAFVNNRIKELNYKIYKPLTLQYIDITNLEGYRVYQRTISFIVHKAIRDLYGSRKFYIRHSLGHGLYCEFADGEELDSVQIEALRRQMQLIISARYPIHRQKLLTEEVEKIYQEYGFEDKITLLNSQKRLYSDIHRMADLVGYFYGALTPDSGYIHLFDIRKYYHGFYIALPTQNDPQTLDLNVHWNKMFDIFQEYHQWVDIMGIPTIGHLNEKFLAGDSSELIKIAEAFHEKKIAAMADQIDHANSAQGTRVVLISGPSSSGKTTTAKRLGIQLRILGLDPVLISLDDYFVNREKTPRDESGDYDFEALEAIDLELLNSDLKRLMNGESVEVPRYDFISGTRQWHDKPLKLNERSVLIMEGIHGLNPRLTPSIPRDKKFCIYVSCLTSVAMDSLTRISTSDNRLLRRITRDYSTRGCDALSTLQRWPSVRRGEEKHIFPYQENADVIFNSSLFYEISILRSRVEPILREVPDIVPEYGEAKRLLKFLQNFLPLSSEEIPPTSLLREFIGGSSFKY